MCAECAKKASPSPMWRNIRNRIADLSAYPNCGTIGIDTTLCHFSFLVT